MKVLVVEDDAAMGRLALDVLEDEGHEVSLAKSAGEAMKILGDKSFDSIVTDLMLPDVSGVELLYKLRQTKIPVTIMSGLSKEVIIEELLNEMGIRGVIQKPFTPDELALAVNKIGS